MLKRLQPSRHVFAAALLVLLAAPLASAMDHVTLRREGQQLYVDGRVILQAQDGGLLFLGRDGRMWRMLPGEIVNRTSDDQPFRAYPPDELSKRTLAELPPGFSVYRTEHYMIFYSCSRAYAQWCGSLLERLNQAFRNAWGRQGFDLAEPECRPLVAVIFADKPSFVRFMDKTFGDSADSIYGYYEFETSNRIIMYDLTGTVAAHPRGTAGAGQINQLLSSSGAAGAVCTIVHEATHQIAFNCGLHQRLSDCPRWFSEGIAMYCETPDLKSSKGWAGIGRVNSNRFGQFQQFLQQRRPVHSLKSLVTSDDRLLKADEAIDAYAESWALTYFLIHKHAKEYIAYLKVLSRKQPLVVDAKEKRLAEFESHFGPLDKLEAEFVAFMEKGVR